MDKAGQQAFIASAADPAKQSEQRSGVPASVTLAQAILESGWGEHHLGDANNYFGIKAQEKNGKVVFGDVATRGFAVDKTTKEFDKNGQAFDRRRAFPRVQGYDGSFIDHGLFLTAPRYSEALKAYAKNKDAKEYARGLQRPATRPTPIMPTRSFR